jgi:hypothetical protein
MFYVHGYILYFYLQIVPKIVAKRQKIGNKKMTQTNNL